MQWLDSWGPAKGMRMRREECSPLSYQDHRHCGLASEPLFPPHFIQPVHHNYDHTLVVKCGAKDLDVRAYHIHRGIWHRWEKGDIICVSKGRRNWTNEGDLRPIPKGGSFSCSLAANEWEGVTGSYTTQCTECSYVALKNQHSQLNKINYKTITSTTIYSQCNVYTHKTIQCMYSVVLGGKQYNTIGRRVIFFTVRYTIYPDYTIKHIHISHK